MNTKNQNGFTIIELVVVMVILGILSATALPKYMSMSGEAERAVVVATSASFVSGINLVKSKALVQRAQSGSYVKVADGEYFQIGVDYNAHAYTEAAAKPVTAATAAHSVITCVALFNGVFQDGGPVAAATATSDYTATPGNGVAATPTTSCHYKYTADTERHFTYNTLSGSIVLVNE